MIFGHGMFGACARTSSGSALGCFTDNLQIPHEPRLQQLVMLKGRFAPVQVALDGRDCLEDVEEALLGSLKPEWPPAEPAHGCVPLTHAQSPRQRYRQEVVPARTGAHRGPAGICRVPVPPGSQHRYARPPPHARTIRRHARCAHRILPQCGGSPASVSAGIAYSSCPKLRSDDDSTQSNPAPRSVLADLPY